MGCVITCKSEMPALSNMIAMPRQGILLPEGIQLVMNGPPGQSGRRSSPTTRCQGSDKKQMATKIRMIGESVNRDAI
jgi:hypothetical protein